MYDPHDLLRFDPCHEWLGIPPAEQPPNHYRLLGLSLFESNPTVIVNAADRQLAHLRTFATGPRGVMTQPLANQISEAAIVLMSHERKAAYDASLAGTSFRPPPLPPQLPRPAIPMNPQQLVQEFLPYPPRPIPLLPPLPAPVPQLPQSYQAPTYQAPNPDPAEPLQLRRRFLRRRKKQDPGAIIMEVAKIVGGAIAGIAVGFVIIYLLSGVSPEEFVRTILKAVGG